MSFYDFARGLCKVYLKIFHRISYIGEENIPVDGPAVFCANHVSNFDPVILGSTGKRAFLFFAKDELMQVPILKTIFRSLNLIPVKRGAGDIGAVKKAIQALSDNQALVMFPEGTRSKDGKLGEGKNGVALIVKKAACTVVPCAVKPPSGLFGKAKVVYGKPMDMSAYKDERDLTVITGDIMDKIRALMEEYF